MKRILLIAVMTLTLFSTAYAMENKPINDQKSIPLEQYSKRDGTKRHRAPERFSMEAYYEEASNSITIIYNGAAEGIVTLSYEGTVIASQPEINTTFELPYESGRHTIEVETDNWSATGYMEL